MKARNSDKKESAKIYQRTLSKHPASVMNGKTYLMLGILLVHGKFLIIMQIDPSIKNYKERISTLRTKRHWRFTQRHEKVGRLQKIDFNVIPTGLCNIIESTLIWRLSWAKLFCCLCFLILLFTGRYQNLLRIVYKWNYPGKQFRPIALIC